LFALDRATFNNLVKDSAVRRRKKYEEFLTKVELLQGMEEYDRVCLADAIYEEKFKQGEHIIKQGDSGDRFFFILSGEAIATKRLEPGKAPIDVMEYSKGSYFGELALINDAPRAANVIAKTDVDIISLDKDTFIRIMGSADDLIKSNIDKYEDPSKSGKLEKDIYQYQNVK
jgi:cAMP-dependent protein kinase regulator